MRRRLAGVVLVVAALFLASTNHYPVFVAGNDDPARPHVISDSGRSFAFYGRVDATGRDYFRFEGEAGQTIPFEILVPERDELRTFRPRVDVIGPGLGECDTEAHVAAGLGCARVPAHAGPSSYYHALTQAYYWNYTDPQESRVTLPEDGTYVFVVSVDAGEGGPYAVATGRRDSYSVTDLLLFPLEWTRVRLWFFS